MSDGFTSRKLAILVALNSDTPDKSPKGYVDEPLLPLIVLINNHKDYVTTSSCSGRICTYLEGMNELQSEELYMQDMEAIESRVAQDNGDKDGGEDAQVAKGYEENTSLAAVEAAKRAKGGQWLYVSHDPVVFPSEQDTEDQQWIINTLFGSEAHRVVPMEDSSETRTLDMARSQLVYFKFEPMILHIEASTPAAAKTFLNHSLFSGYRNSGILPSAKRTMLAIRSTLKLDAPIAYIPSTSSTMPSSIPKIHLMVSVAYLRVLVELSNDKFQMNVAQMSRFEKRLAEYLNSDADLASKKMGDQGEWEDKDARRERKRKEGLLKKQQAAMRKAEAETRDAKVQEHSNEDPNTDAGSTAGIATSVQ
ncbi:methyltransferase TYW3-domain-containing protein [Gamsiella multidivaricata]|uniref:methyltransferase TYW3-domain-containing protein n=1 Tax=Gamsiella multidivaricata TaxID=101098 RepID=UPI0022202702|nr:methyltransferase TYW3-domain-containing protein [Gamsiella multidivaricata]KAI7828033.1 methyltransferase TYW3-domain-containing protein [Gamsiella multidivaricata]